MSDVRDIHDLQLTYGLYMTTGRHTECPRFTVDVQDTSALWKTVRTPRTNQAQTKNYLSAIGINFPTPSHTTKREIEINPNFNMENQNIRVSIPWEHSLTNLLGHDSTSDPGIALRQWVHVQGVENILDLLSWEEDELRAIPAQQVFTIDDHGQGSYLRTNQTKQICGLITYMKHVFREYNSGIEVRTDPFHPFFPEEWNQHTSTMLRTFLIQHLPNPIGPQPVISGPISSSRPTGYSPAAIELMSFKKGIKREIAAYPSLKDERYFDGFKRSLFIVAKTHECSEVLDPNYTPGSEPEEEELFVAKQTFMFSVFNTNLQTDMGKTIVRRHLASTDAQAVWNELSEHMRTSSKGASEKRRLTQYVTNTVLDDNFKGTTEQFVLHFNEQFRQLEEISEDDERLPPSVKLTLL